MLISMSAMLVSTSARIFPRFKSISGVLPSLIYLSKVKPEYGILTTSHLTWAPDSMRIAFDAFTGPIVDDRHDEIWAVDIDGNNLVNLTNGLGGFAPAWQPVVPSATATSVEAQSWGQIKSLLSR